MPASLRVLRLCLRKVMYSVSSLRSGQGELLEGPQRDTEQWAALSLLERPAALESTGTWWPPRTSRSL